MSYNIDQINKEAGIATTKINDVDYTIALLPATVGLAMSLEISKLIAPSIGSTVDGLRHDEVMHGAPATFSDLAEKLVGQMGKVNVVAMINSLLGKTEVDGKVINFDTHFRGNYGSMFQLVEFALRENFESFFTGSGLQTRFQTIMATMAPQVPELEESLEK